MMAQAEAEKEAQKTAATSQVSVSTYRQGCARRDDQLIEELAVKFSCLQCMVSVRAAEQPHAAAGLHSAPATRPARMVRPANAGTPWVRDLVAAHPTTGMHQVERLGMCRSASVEVYRKREPRRPHRCVEVDDRAAEPPGSAVPLGA